VRITGTGGDTAGVRADLRRIHALERLADNGRRRRGGRCVGDEKGKLRVGRREFGVGSKKGDF
jgi:hypothetical protein